MDAYIRWLIALDLGRTPVVAVARWISQADSAENERIRRYAAQAARRESA